MNRERLISALEALKISIIGVWIMFTAIIFVLNPSINPPLVEFLTVFGICGIPVYTIDFIICKLYSTQKES